MFGRGVNINDTTVKTNIPINCKDIVIIPECSELSKLVVITEKILQ